MPPVMYMDSYELCQQDTDALYCMSEYVLVSDKPSPLLTMIQEFSEHSVSHYNHTKLRYGTCITQTCQKFYDLFDSDLKLILEACLNETLSTKYDLKVRILNDIHCKQPGTVMKDIDQLDIIVGIIFTILLIANIVGSLTDYHSGMKAENIVFKLLKCFSLIRNWKKLMALDADVSDPRSESLNGLHGIRYLAVDMQLYIAGVIFFLSCRSSRSRKIALSLLFLAGMIMPASHVYFQDLDGIQLITPEETLSLFATDPHFNNIYTRFHTNIIGYVIGMALGYLVYHWQTQRIDVKQWQKPIYRILYYSSVLLGLWCGYIGSIFYQDAPRQPLYVRVLCAAFIKPIFGFFIAILLIGLIFKFEDRYRGFLEWNVWRRTSRLTYSAYLLHFSLIRIIITMRTSTIQVDTTHTVKTTLTLLTMTFITALVFWLLVEAPFSNIMKEYLSTTKRKDKKKNKIK
ncbi:unnamed protein product [Arctia plantaginis]|uniref:Acyltransferase 3 domain-containing protein n=1 Tax=Arctia plantaginis TaxID=874455 RepID=A0A8S1AGP4_ARCPL|nr:unnamed protein product [Arctia plantaginis]